MQCDRVVGARFFVFSFRLSSRVALSPQLYGRQLVTVSDNIAQLTRVTKLEVRLFVVSCRALTPSPPAPLQRLHRNPVGRVDHDAADVFGRESPTPIRSSLTVACSCATTAWSRFRLRSVASERSRRLR